MLGAVSRHQIRFAVVLASAALLGAGCGSEDPPERGPGSPLADPAANEASPEAEPESAGADPGELEAGDRERVSAAVRAYIASLNRHDASALCAAFAPGAVRSCASTAARIGSGGRGGTPAWRRTTIRELKAVSVGEDEARVTATVTHDFSDRSYVSLEEDVIYLVRGPGGGWLIAKPSGSFYRAIGFPEPPLSSLTPP
jgi:hypothetical protein